MLCDVGANRRSQPRWRHSVLSPEKVMSYANDSPSAETIDLIEEFGGDMERNSRGDVVFLNLFLSDVTDDALLRIGRYDTLETLTLPPQITDAGISHLAGLSRLKQLYINATRISDTGLKIVGDLRNLRDLFLSHTPITDAGLAHLVALTGLEKLYLNGTQITDDGLAHVAKLSNLKMLVLSSDVAITDAGVAHLAALQNLEQLYLPEGITDDGIQYLSRMTHLRQLDLEDTHISDAGLHHLSGLHNLTKIYLWGTRVTAAGVANLRRVLPAAKIESPVG